MTDIKIKKLDDEYQIRIKGHAGYNPGNDIVCAAVSTLCYTLMQSLEDARNLCDELDIRIQDADVSIWVKPKKENEADIEWIVRTVRTGFEGLTREYPEWVRATAKNQTK